MTQRTCTVEGCINPRRGRIHCKKHLRWLRMYGTLSPEMIGNRARQAFPDLDEVMESRTIKGPDCWIWTGTKDAYGYPQVGYRREKLKGHRVAYELAKGEIPDGHVIDHVCHTPLCVRPDHLRAVTVKQNTENHSGATSASKSGIRGVWWDGGRSKWAVQVTHSGKVHWGGYHATKEAANAAAIELRTSLHTHNDLDREYEIAYAMETVGA